MTVYIAVSY